MNFLLVNYEYPPVGAGAATATKAIAHSLNRAGHNVLVLTGSYADEPRRSNEEDVVVCRVHCRRARADCSNVGEMMSFLCAGLFALPKILRERHIDGAIIFFSFPCGPLGLLARLLHGVPYVISLRGGDVPGAEPSLGKAHRLLQPLRRQVLRRARAVVANSDGLRKMSLAADPISVGVIPNGVDTDFFRPKARSSSERFRVLFVGRFQKQKNLQLLLQEFAHLSRRAELDLVGDGPLRSELEAQAAKLGLDGAVKWHGWLGREALRDALQSCDCFVNPSFYEGMPNAVIEAMACGKPVIASRVAGNDAVVRDGKTGFLFSLDRPELLRESLRALIDDPARASEMGQAGRRVAERDFCWTRVAAAYADLFSRRLAPASAQDALVSG